jgi:2-polyprenyl-6-methoxyphenol hydroxylase-like FAD-dependent oxidoreductase
VSERVLIVGAGPTGLTLALELARFDVASTILDEKTGPTGEGSRAIVLARHALTAWDRLACAGPMLAKAVVLARARTYFRETELFSREFPPPEPGEIPAFVNLQQVETERVLRDALAGSTVELRWDSPVAGLRQDEEGVTLALGSGEKLRGAYAVGCDGGHSSIRSLLGIPFTGSSHRDRFLICDVRAQLGFPNERRFFFDPPSNPGRTVLIHPQPDDEWRIDWQVAASTDPEEERRSSRLHERIVAVAGDVDYEVVWLTSYRFHQRVAERWRAGRVFLAGDAAHLFSPFGARGMNSGVEDAVNVGWKLALVLRREAGEALLETYERERRPAALENLAVTARTMRFMAPPTRLHRLVRDAILRGSVRSGFLRRRVDSGRLAEAAVYDRDDDPVLGRPLPAGTPLDAAAAGVPGFAVAHFGGETYLVRPDGYAAARVAGAVKPALRLLLWRP